MAKGIIVVQVPKNCFFCVLKKKPSISFPEYTCCDVTGKSISKYKPNNVHGTKPEWCPIKLIPDRKGRSNQLPMYDTDIHYEIGWNACLDEILKEK